MERCPPVGIVPAMAGPGLEHSPGWYPDPTGRFEFRYHNGSSWTADVADGGARFVDQLSTVDDGARPGGPPRRERLAGWSMALGIVGVVLGWMPYVVVAGAIASLLAIVFATVVRRRASGGAPDPRSGVGLLTGAIGLVVAVAGVFLTFVVDDALDRYQHPAPHRAEVTACSTTGGLASADIEITSERGADDGAADFTVLLWFVRAGTDNVLASASLELDDVEPGDTATASASRRIADSAGSAPAVDCVIGEVNGPFPFGLDVGW